RQLDISQFVESLSKAHDAAPAAWAGELRDDFDIALGLAVPVVVEVRQDEVKLFDVLVSVVAAKLEDRPLDPLAPPAVAHLDDGVEVHVPDVRDVARL